MSVTLKDVKEGFWYIKDVGRFNDVFGEGYCDDTSVSLTQILELTNWIGDAVWSLRMFVEDEKKVRLFAVECAERVLPITESRNPNNKAPRECIELARKFINDEVSIDYVISKREDYLNDLKLRVSKGQDSESFETHAELSCLSCLNEDAYLAAHRATGGARVASCYSDDDQIEFQTELFKRYFC